MNNNATFEETMRCHTTRHLFGDWYIIKRHSNRERKISLWRPVNKKWFKPSIEDTTTPFAFSPRLISHLIQGSSYISELCRNEIETLRNGNIVWFHHLPRIDDNEPAIEENWNLSEEDVIKVKTIRADLIEYIVTIHKLSKKTNQIRARLGNIVDFLPPWVAFPLYSENDICWCAGGGKVYLKLFQEFLDSLSKDEFDTYMQAYHVPFWYQHWDIKRSQDIE